MGGIMLTPNLEKIPQELKDDRLKIDSETARRFLQAIFDKYIREAYRPTYIEVRGKRDADEVMTFRRFYLGIDPLIKDMNNWPADQHYWFGVALRWSDTHGTKEHCIVLTVIFTDVDYGKIGHKRKNRWQTREEAQAAIDDFPIEPSIIVHTGGGFQVYWILAEPLGLNNGNRSQIETIMKGVGVAIGGDDGTQDVSRIFRVPGTYNVKTDEPRPVEIIRCNPDLVYHLADFADYADLAVPPEPISKEAQPHDGLQTTIIEELNVPAWVRGLILSGDASGYDNDRSKRDHAVIRALKRAGCKLDTIEAIYREHPIGDRFLEEERKQRGGRKYLQMSFDKEAGARTQAPPDDPTEFTDTQLLNFAKAGQVGDSRLFIRLFAGKFVYDHAAGRWHRWGKHYWVEDELEDVLMALDRVVDLYQQAAGRCAWRKAQAIREGDEKAAKNAGAEETIFLKKIASLQNKKWRRDVLEFAAAGEGSLGIGGQEWDRNTMLVACPSGVINLVTGEFGPGRPEDFIKIACPTEWKDMNEPAPEWEKFLLQVFNGDVEVVNYLRRLSGYAISGQRKERVMPVAWGGGWNGKGTTFETLGETLGDLAGPVPAEILLEDGKNYRTGGSPTPEIMRLRGKRLVWASETNEGRKLNPGKVKWLTGGDTLVGRDPYGKRMVSFLPTHTLFLMTNYKPKANPDDFALWQRINLIPFKLSFVDNPTEPQQRQRDKDIADRLKKESSGILAWIVRGFFEWKEQGLNPPATVQEATAEYRETEDTIGQFIAEQCVVVESAKVQASELYRSYESWCAENGHKPVWGNTFGQRISAKFSKKPTKKGIFYFGIGIKSFDSGK
jgi:putative DNA primase/helicase